MSVERNRSWIMLLHQ
uniref:Uncharacterized protein n=1 Tax=Rhizophora mucronata TaxID=61149 RepID=A0A2P2IV53_RHIMU